jgi:hypothetical protein
MQNAVNDAAAESTERVIKGPLLKFANGNWSRGKEGTNIEEGTKLVALDTAAAWVKWSDGRPVEYRLRQLGHRLPERKDLGDLDERNWEMGLDGKPKDPWQNTRFVYLIDPVSAEAFTFGPHPSASPDPLPLLGKATVARAAFGSAASPRSATQDASTVPA